LIHAYFEVLSKAVACELSPWIAPIEPPVEPEEYKPHDK
jgi:hypothetical protein